MDRGFFSNLQQSKRHGIITVDFSDVRSLQILTDKVKRLIHLLKLNKNLCDHLRAFFNRLKLVVPLEMKESFLQHEIMIENYYFQTEIHISRLESIVSRAQGVGTLVSIILKDLSAYNKSISKSFIGS